MMTRHKPMKTRGQRGAAAVEMALVLPILVGITFGIIQFGSILFLQNNMVSAAREASRKLAVGEVNVAEAEQAALDYLGNWSMNFTVEANVPDPNDPNDTDVSVEITVPLKEAALVDVLGLFGTSDLKAAVTMRQEF